MHEAALGFAALPAPAVVLGLPMRPYCLGHELFLIRENNPLVCPSGRIDFPALAKAVFICHHTPEEMSWLSREWLAPVKTWLWMRRARRMDFGSALATWQAYRADGSMEFPESEMAQRGQAPRLPGAPFLLRLQQWLVITLRLSEREAWEYPLGLAKMQWQAYWEEQGGYQVKNDHDVEFERFVAEQEVLAQQEGGRTCQV